MRVLQLGKYFPPMEGGIETVTWRLAEGLAQAGVQGDVLCFNPQGPDSVEQWKGYRVFRAATPRVLHSAPLSWRVVGLLRELAPRYDILHVHCPNPTMALALWLARPKARVVLHWHSDVIRQRLLGALFRPLERWLIRRAAAVIGATPAHVEASPHRALFKGKAAVIPFCIDPAFAQPGSLDQETLDGLARRFAGRKAVFSLGRLISYKGLEHLIAAAGLLPDHWVALIGGQGPLRDALRGEIERQGLGRKVFLLGRIPERELSAHYAFSRVFCLPSTTRAEMFGMVQLEALAMGRPIVSTNIPGSGVPYVNEHGVTGLVVPPGDPAALARAILDIDGDETRYQALSDSCRRVFARRYVPGAVMAATVDLYRKILAT